ncbi:MAG TPA: adenylate/guanylate cyclase domain-containing protein [Polyangiales bacterium]|nr:adenylate/guanylate cyclase domain-containing protein [Polyangiales bacterium]
MQPTFINRVLPQTALVDAWLSDLSQLGNSALTTLRIWPAPVRAKAFARALRQPPRVTLLVTDLVEFSSLLTTLGDYAGHKLIQSHNSILRACLRQHGGREAAHTGDGIIASFGDPVAAASCAQRIQRSLHAQRARNPQMPLRARIGLHAGRPLPEEGRLFGGCVNYAVRVCAQAEADEVLVSDCVRALIASDFVCEERAPVLLKGFAGLHKLHALSSGLS